MPIIDLSLPIVHGMPGYPGDPKVVVRALHRLERQGWRLNLLHLGSHAGSHVNVPAHMLETGANLSQLGPQRFMGRAACLARPEAPPPNLGLLLCGEATTLDAARIIQAGAPFVGYPASFELPVEVEKNLLAAGIPVYENLVNLELLPAGSTFLFIGLPLLIENGEGSPVRAVAVLD